MFLVHELRLDQNKKSILQVLGYGIFRNSNGNRKLVYEKINNRTCNG